MQAMEVSGGKGYVTAIGVHPIKKIIACGFSRGTIKLFDLSDKPRFLTSAQTSSSEVTDLTFTPSGHYLGVSFSNGQAVILDSSFENISLTLEDPWVRSQSAIQTIKFHESLDNDGYCIKAATLKDACSIQLQVFEAIEGELERTHFNLFPIEGKSTGFEIHSSGMFLLVTTNTGAVYIYNIDNSEIAGIIETDIGARGCILDPSGLYIGVLIPNQFGVYHKFAIYETGTGKKSTELSRLDNCGNFKGVCWSKDGRFIIISGATGLLSVWKIPKAMTETIFDMMEKLQANPDIWIQFPINLPVKERATAFRASKTKSRYPEQQLPEIDIPEARRDQGAFAESVISFVKKPIKKPKQESDFANRLTLKPAESTEQFTLTSKSRYEMPKEDSPVSLTRKNRQSHRSPIPTRSQPSNFYYQNRSAIQKTVTSDNPAIVKSSNKFNEPDSIDIDCDVPTYNPAQRLYESRSEKSESLASDKGYQDIDQFY